MNLLKHKMELTSKLMVKSTCKKMITPLFTLSRSFLEAEKLTIMISANSLEVKYLVATSVSTNTVGIVMLNFPLFLSFTVDKYHIGDATKTTALAPAFWASII